MTSSKRAGLSPPILEMQQLLGKLFLELDKNPHHYASLYFERKRKKTFEADLKQKRAGESTISGAVFRIYDGHTLFEQATDDLAEKELRRSIQALLERVRSAPQTGSNRPYRAPVWKERLSGALEPELRSQIPQGVTAQTPVHFGIRYEEDPFEGGDLAWAERGQDFMARLFSYTSEVALKPSDLSYAKVRQGFAVEESLFIDRESNLSQTLYRPSLGLQAMSGEAMTYLNAGGLGGRECIAVEDCELLTLLRDLRALRKPARLEPGKHRVLFSPGLTGVLAHEAFGHSQEGDTCARGRSKAWDLSRSGERVGNERATILNNPAIYENGAHSYGAWGSYFFDEEGWLARSQTLLDRGQLHDPMTNLTSALRLDVERTANGKRENWSHGVYTRQTNTYFSAGDRTYAQLIEQVGDGFLGTRAAGGMEDPKGMGIQVGILYLLEIKGGKLTGRAFRGPAGGDIQMTGYTPDVLGRIEAKSKIEDHNPGPDRARHPYIEVGGCGKYHKEIVLAGCGGPYLLLDQVTLG